MHIQDITERVTAQLDEFRDRTAEAVRADSDSVFREVSKLASRIDAAEEGVVDRIDRLDDDHSARWDVLEAATRRTTWPRRIVWLGLGIAAGMAVTYLGDPDRGKARRAQFSDQLAARTREVANKAADQAKMAADRTKGSIIETAKQAIGQDTATSDPALLTQRIKSDVFGRRDDVGDVVIRIDAPGEVALKGTMPTEASKQELVDSVSRVDGVIDVRSELAVRMH